MQMITQVVNYGIRGIRARATRAIRYDNLRVYIDLILNLNIAQASSGNVGIRLKLAWGYVSVRITNARFYFE